MTTCHVQMITCVEGKAGPVREKTHLVFLPRLP